MWQAGSFPARGIHSGGKRRILGGIEVARVTPPDLGTVPGDEGTALFDVDFEDFDGQDFDC